MAKKINVKDVAKAEVAAVLRGALETAFGVENVIDGPDYGFKAHSVVVKGIGNDNIDIRVDLTNPKAGQNTYDYVLDKIALEAAEDAEPSEEA